MAMVLDLLITGKQYKALCDVAYKESRKWERPHAAAWPWYDPVLQAVVATDSHVIVCVNYDGGDSVSWCTADPSEVKARDTVAFDSSTAIDGRNAAPFSSDTVRSLLRGLPEPDCWAYNPDYVIKLAKFAKAFNCYLKPVVSKGRVGVYELIKMSSNLHLGYAAVAPVMLNGIY